MAERFYINCPLQIGPATLDGAEARHLALVRRFRPGDDVCLFNGDGYEYPARIIAVTRRQVELEVVGQEAPQRELPFNLHVAAPVPKGDRAQFLVEKLTELGAASFVPLETERSVVHPREAKLEKLQRHVIEASKQCGRNILMDVRPMENWSEYCCRTDLPLLRLLAQPGGVTDLPRVIEPGEAVVCAVGPEGGFTVQESASAVSAGWRLIDLGPCILRVETAALVLATAISRPALKSANQLDHSN